MSIKTYDTGGVKLLKDFANKTKVSDKEVLQYDQAFAARMKTLRDERGLKRDWVARQLNVHYNTLKNWELAKAHPGTRELLQLSRIYNIDVEEFFSGLG